MSQPECTPPTLATSPGADQGDRGAVLQFVRSPFAIRRNVVRIWRPLPANLWSTLSTPEDRDRATRRERSSVAGVVFLALSLSVGFSGVGLRISRDGTDRCFPLLGRSQATVADGSPAPGWYYSPGESLSLAIWVVIPSLMGWAFVRKVWIPLAVVGESTRDATLTFCGHLGAVYFYVYLMVAIGAGLMPLLILLSPAGTETFRWCFWCFLFGESFFVPAVMWSRFVMHDVTGRVFGRQRITILALYLLLTVVLPICGMIGELD